MAATAARLKKDKLETVVGDARAAQLAAFINATNKAHKNDGSVTTFVGAPLDVPVISTGALTLDVALGAGGLPRGRITEIFGPESAGKTSLALSTAARAIKAGGMAAIIDVEHAVSPAHALSMGINLDYFALSQPNSGEEALQMLDEMLEADVFDVIVIDSVAALIPRQILEAGYGDATVGAQARLMSSGLQKLTPKIAESKAVVIFINQLRMKIGVMFGNPEDTPGGKALKYYASCRLSVTSPAGGRIPNPTVKDQYIGLTSTVRVVKNKIAPPQQKAEYRLIWGEGIDFESSVFAAALTAGALVADGGNAYTVAATGEVLMSEGKIVRGKDNVQTLLRSRPDLAAELADLVYVSLRRDGVAVSASELAITIDDEADEVAVGEQDWVDPELGEAAPAA